MIRKTTTNRFLITHQDLSYATTSDGLISPSKIHDNDIRYVNDAPTLELARLISAAKELLPTFKEMPKRSVSFTNLRNKLAEQAQLAAAEHMICCEMPLGNHQFTAKTHIFTTNHRRYIISPKWLDYAHSNTDPSIIVEANIHPKDYAQCIILGDKDLAQFLHRAISGKFSKNAETLERFAHNHVIYDATGNCLIRDGKEYRSLDDILNSPHKLTLFAHLDHILMQREICKLFQFINPNKN